MTAKKSAKPARKASATKKRTTRGAAPTRVERMAEAARALRVEHRAKAAQVAEFSDRDMPAFDAWVREEFQAEKAELRRVTEELEFQTRLLHEARNACITGASRDFASALKTVRARLKAERKERADPPEDAGGPDDEDVFDDDGLDDFEHGAGAPDELVDDLFPLFMAQAWGIDVDTLDPAAREAARREFAASFEHAAIGNLAEFENSLLRASTGHDRKLRAAVKTIYRRLAKQLHPDSAESLTDVERELWDEATAAYAALDLEEMEAIEVTLLVERRLPIPESLEPVLKSLVRQLEADVDDVDEEIESCREHPAWGFSGRRRSKAFVRRLRNDIICVTEEMRARLDEALDLIDILSRHRRPPKRKATKRKASSKKRKAAPRDGAGAEPRKAARKKKAPNAQPAPPPTSGPDTDDHQSSFPF